MKLHNFVVLALTFVFYPLTLNSNAELTTHTLSLEEQQLGPVHKSPTTFIKEHQENLPNLQTKLLDLDEKVRELNGKVQYLDHTNKKLSERINNLSIDINSRISALEGKNISKRTVSDTAGIDTYIKMIEAKNYLEAISGLKEYIVANKGIIDLDEAYYWMGKAYMFQDMYEEAGSHFFKNYTQYPHKNKASESLLNVAISFMKLEKYNSGCKILDSLDKEYPNRNASEKSKSEEMRTFMECPT